jgi:hypothetical protein
LVWYAKSGRAVAGWVVGEDFMWRRKRRRMPRPPRRVGHVEFTGLSVKGVLLHTAVPHRIRLYFLDCKFGDALLQF